ncbi:MAG: hypothetical protein IPJ65_19705 [Archangiaceae bacterium]|nr:hypothetical protein [Archangiaceae bacterium]
MLRSKTLNLQLSPLAALILAAGLPACSGPSPNDGGAGGGSGCLSSCPVAACGQLPDGCGGVLECGACAAGMTCGAGGAPNVCAPACARGCPLGFACDARGICAGDGGSLTIDVPTVRVRAVVKVNGTSPTVAPPPSFTLPTSAASALSLRERSSDSVLALTAACTAAVGQPCPLTFEGTVYPGDYRVGLGAARLVELPEAASNRLDLLDRFSIELAPSLRIEAADAGLNYDVTTRTLQVTLTVNGAAPTNASGSPTAVSVVLVETTTGAEVELTAPCSTPMGQPCPLTTTAALPPGTYRAARLSTGLVEGLPFFANELTFDGPTVTVTPTQTTLSIDLQSYSVRGRLTVNGTAVMPSAPTLRITDRDGGTATVVSLPCLNPGACDPRFSFSLVRGTYRVIAETTLIDPSTRFNGSHVVHEALVVTQPLAELRRRSEDRRRHRHAHGQRAHPRPTLRPPAASGSPSPTRNSRSTVRRSRSGATTARQRAPAPSASRARCSPAPRT